MELAKGQRFHAAPDDERWLSPRFMGSMLELLVGGILSGLGYFVTITWGFAPRAPPQAVT
jgi:hypothetical protein